MKASVIDIQKPKSRTGPLRHDIKIQPCGYGERPEEPQLPLYAVSAGEPPAAVVYAVIRNDGCQYLGLVNAPGLFPGLPQEGKRYEYLAEAGRDLPGTTAEWKVTLHRLMAEFLAALCLLQ